ncbi:hypothetical protein SDC9_61115 [bioreactor metagenome]|uniref:Colanic acid/amylovoran biosynthesis protein n=2 Tax=root TaxID=1 RepID=A0A4R8LW24_9BACT|nr:polysaccharide pyruvyl transferase family protein [Aminivibrio pyruvatiphilus]TDY52097.1 colanic acid/amylovoran biosynthesis protein [Aminivibrio pyruvatiphilus]
MKKPIRIHISHIPNTFNYGSAMMAIALIDHLARLCPEDLVFYTDASSPEDLERLQASTGLSNIHVLPPYDGGFTRPAKWKDMPKWRKVLCIPALVRSGKKRQDYLVKNSDLEIILGGDDLSEYYGKRFVAFELANLWYISRKISLILPGQTIGPFTSYRKKWASFCLKKTLLYTRDDPTWEYCVKELGLENASSSRDLAFLDLPFQNNKEEEDRILSRYSLEPGKYATVVGSGLTAHYTERRSDFIDNFAEILREIAGREDVEKLVFLAHVVRPVSSDDRFVMRDVVNCLKDRSLDWVLKKLVIIDDELLPYEARLILGNGRWTITGRMHAAISSIQMGKPVIALSYSVKYDGVLSKGMGISRFVIDACGTEKWTDCKIAKEVRERIDFIESEYQALCGLIEKRRRECEERAFQQVSEIASIISGLKRSSLEKRKRLS